MNSTKLKMMAAMMKKPLELPYDMQVEYLESTGEQYIKTNINGDARIVGCAQSTQIKGSSQVIICSSPGDAATWIGEAGNTQRWGLGTSSGTYADIIVTTKAIFDITFTDTSAFGTVNDINISRTTAHATNDEWNIFAGKNGSFPFSGKIFYIRIYKDNILVCDFIPVRKGNVGYMYDKVSGQLFGNSGTGDFILGQDIVPVEYLESTGTQYIDTGIAGNTITRFIIEGNCQRVSATTNSQFIGGTSNSPMSFFGAYYNNNEWFCYDTSINKYLGVSINRTYIDATIKPNITGMLVDKVTNTSYSFDQITNNNSWNFENQNLLLFGGVLSRRSPSAKCYSLKLYTSEELVRDFVPVRIGQVGYMYDKVSNQLFGNAGTGNFVLGQDIIILPAGYTELPYVSSVDNGGWVDTEIVPSDTLGYKVTFLCQNVNPRDNILWGCREDSGNTRYWINLYNSQLIIGWETNQPSSGNRFTISANTWYTLYVNWNNDRTHYFDPNTTKALSGTIPTMTRTFQMFGRINSDGTRKSSESSIARFTFTLGTNIIADMIPCTSPNNEVGFYDIVRERFFGSGNSIPLIAGS